MLPRVISILLGAALFGSAFVWEPRGSPAFVHDLVAGLLVVAIAVAAMAWPRVRYANTAMSFWPGQPLLAGGAAGARRVEAQPPGESQGDAGGAAQGRGASRLRPAGGSGR